MVGVTGNSGFSGAELFFSSGLAIATVGRACGPFDNLTKVTVEFVVDEPRAEGCNLFEAANTGGSAEVGGDDPAIIRTDSVSD